MVARRRLQNKPKASNDPPPVAKFALGDVVQLKSGGPQLTVIDVNGVDLAWFDQQLTLTLGTLPQDCLKLLVGAAPVLLGATANEGETQGEGGYLTAVPEPSP